MEQERHLERGEGITPSGRVVDPSEAVTGLSFLFGAIGALAGIAVAIVSSPQITLATPVYCFVAALAFGSAGVVTGGMIGASFAVLRGVTPRPMPADAADEDIPRRPEGKISVSRATPDGLRDINL